MQSLSQSDIASYNKEVKSAFQKVWTATRKLLATIEQHELRCILIREDPKPYGFGSVIQQLISPLIFLSLECNDGEMLNIHFGIEMLNGDSDYSPITARFLRMLYTFTAKGQTTINIESSIDTDYIVTDCSALYETVEDRMRHHTLQVIPYKPATKRKLKAVA